MRFHHTRLTRNDQLPSRCTSWSKVVLTGALASVCWSVTAGQATEPWPQTAEVTALPQAHAHNDYAHERPLLDALGQGFCSVEADIFLVDDQLLVGHTRAELQTDRTLVGLYLRPLQERVARNGGYVHRSGVSFTLLIDIKTSGPATYARLQEELQAFHDMLTKFTDRGITPGAVTVIISGNRPWENIAATSVRYAGVDGRIADLSRPNDDNLVPLISDRWGSHFRWIGHGEIPALEKQRLYEFVQQAHAKGRRIRFWATPDTPAMWQALVEAGVDHINTDDLKGLASFLKEHSSKP